MGSIITTINFKKGTRSIARRKRHSKLESMICIMSMLAARYNRFLMPAILVPRRKPHFHPPLRRETYMGCLNHSFLCFCLGCCLLDDYLFRPSQFPEDWQQPIEQVVGQDRASKTLLSIELSASKQASKR